LMRACAMHCPHDSFLVLPLVIYILGTCFTFIFLLVHYIASLDTCSTSSVCLSSSPRPNVILLFVCLCHHPLDHFAYPNNASMCNAMPTPLHASSLLSVVACRLVSLIPTSLDMALGVCSPTDDAYPTSHQWQAHTHCTLQCHCWTYLQDSPTN